MRVALLPLTVSTTRTASRLLPLWHLARLRTQAPAGTADARRQGGALRLVQTASAFEALRARERAPSVSRYLGCQVVQARAGPGRTLAPGHHIRRPLPQASCWRSAYAAHATPSLLTCSAMLRHLLGRCAK